MNKILYSFGLALIVALISVKCQETNGTDTVPSTTATTTTTTQTSTTPKTTEETTEDSSTESPDR